MARRCRKERIIKEDPKPGLTGHPVAVDLLLTAVHRDAGTIWHLEVICRVMVPDTWQSITRVLEFPMPGLTTSLVLASV